MRPVRPHRILLIVDANVLIDYAISDRSILALAARHLGPVFVPLPVLDEVEQLTADDCSQLGLTLLDPVLDDLLAAASPRGGLSLEDHLCLVLARANGYTCVTNDKALRRECASDSVPVLWGLELMTELVTRRELMADAAVSTARAIRSVNPHHITADILTRFAERIESLTRRPRGLQE